MVSPRLPIKIKKIAAGYRISFGEDIETYIYVREERVNRNGLSWTEAEDFAKRIARTLSEAWSRDKIRSL